MSNDKTYDRHVNVWINGKQVNNDISYITKAMYKLRNEQAQMTIGSQEYIDKGKDIRKLKGIISEHNESLRLSTGSWGKLKDSFSGAMGKIAGWGTAVMGAIQIAKGVIFSTEGISDRFENIVAGSKEVFWELQNRIANLNFSHLFKGLTEAWERGKKLNDELDKLADERAYGDYIISSLSRESRELQAVTKNVELNIKARSAAADKRDEIEQKIYNRTVELAKRAFQIEKDTWEGRNKMVAEEAVKLYEIVDQMGSDITDKMDKEILVGKELYLGSTSQSIDRLYWQGVQLESLNGIPPETIKTYAEYLRLLESGEKDVLPKLFNSFKNVEQTAADAQERLNTALKEGHILDVKEKKLMFLSMGTHQALKMQFQEYLRQA